ncbi:putative alpha-1,2-mannosidase [Phyllobacterium sp. 1468]|uniref:GH92 family glycosyl hydrolase n=1 Tax=Phyllobacterium sp. 1468 TaxID=2817759 RepID=UPI00285F20D3|nr:GH92 family glycosyl hydrolase [Phyllobacterium sp. 1468]MDR6633717.1 putative alpha-1,2-mannosidase [Phyllobacterium sp. 1468]
MTLRRIFMAGLLASTMLAGCSDDKSPPTDTISQGTYDQRNSRVEALEAGRKSDWATIAELRDSLKQFRADIEARVTGLGKRLDDVDLRVSAIDANQKALLNLQPQVDKLQEKVAALEAQPKISEDDAARIAGLKQLSGDVNGLRTDLDAAVAASAKDIGAIKDEIESHRLALAKTTDADTVTVLTNKIAALEKELDLVAKSGTNAVEAFKTRIAALEDEVKKLRNLRVDVPLTQFVNLFVGTKLTETGGGHSGNVNPGAQTPFGMVSFGPDTKGEGKGWGYGSGGYYYGDSTIRYFSLTHLNGPGCRGQGAVAILPKDEGTAMTTKGIAYSHSKEDAEPGYYQVKFDNGINSEFTATTRTGMSRFTFDDKDKAFLIIDASRNNSNQGGGQTPSNIEIATDNKSVSGQALAPAFCGGTWKQPVYFYATFDKPLKASSIANAAATLQFELTDADKSVQIKIGISSVSVANAKLNLETENAGWSLDAVKKQSSDIWNQRLNTIQLDLADPEEFRKLQQDKQADATKKLKQFYTALYRVYSGPTVFSDVNGEYRSMKQAGGGDLPVRATENVANYKFTVDGKDAGYKTHYSGFSMWDTYRSQAQLLAWIAPDEASEMMQSLVADAQQCGAFPHWVDGSEDTTPMSGDHAPNVLAGSYMFGARHFDLDNATKYLRQSATTGGSCNDKANPDKDSFQAYSTKGYVPFIKYDDHSASRTLEMVITDQSIASLLDALPTKGADKATIDDLHIRASNWKNIFDDSVHKLRPKDQSGAWKDGEFHELTEANYIWSFGHDWTALIDRLGGKEKAIDRLNTLFSYKSFSPADEPSGKDLNGGETSSNYYIGNEPAFSTPWAYNWAGSPKYAQYIIPVIMRKNFSLNPGGLPGNDDMGALSGWYVWSALGLYPVIPSAPGMAVSTPQFSGATLWLGNGKRFRIETDKQALLDDVRYISAMRFNDAEYKGTWLPLDKIRNGGKLSFTLSDKPTEWGSAPELTPPSGPSADYSKATAKEASNVQMIDALEQ